MCFYGGITQTLFSVVVGTPLCLLCQILLAFAWKKKSEKKAPQPNIGNDTYLTFTHKKKSKYVKNKLYR